MDTSRYQCSVLIIRTRVTKPPEAGRFVYIVCPTQY